MSRKKTGMQWERVNGSDLDSNNKPRAERNQVILKDKIFIEACKQVNIEPTKRQASRWSRKTGIAFKAGRK